MSNLTILIIIWAVYQLASSLRKKAPQPPGSPADPRRIPDSGTVRETLEGPAKPRGSWLEQIQQAIDESARQGQERNRQEEVVPPQAFDEDTRQMEESFGQAIPLRATDSKDIEDSYVQTNETTGPRMTSSFERLYTTDLKSTTDEAPPQAPQIGGVMLGNSYFIRKEDLTQGIIWAEVLGKPRARHPFRGPR